MIKKTPLEWRCFVSFLCKKIIDVYEKIIKI